jgi:ribosomal protein S18 acetylase RimI-like enzyme
MHAVDVLDNPVWHALGGPQANVAEGNGLAVRFDPAISVFAAVPDDATTESWAALAALIGSDPAVIVRDTISVPAGWRKGFRAPGTQMVCDRPVDDVPTIGPLAVEILTPASVPEMLDLVERTRPGPMLPRTIELGTYVGIRERGTLVAMTGTRMHPPGFTEISAVCTDDEHRGRGLAQVLVAHMLDEILGRGDVACLHVVTTNVPAIRLYERLGFTTRREMDFAFLGAPSC